MHPWWSAQQASLIGAVGGSLYGLYGGLLGTVAGLCAPRGKCKRTVYAMTGLLLAMGVGCLGSGTGAVILRQPYGVWYPLLLGGTPAAILGGIMVPLVRLRYREADNRRLEAEQLRRG